MDDPEATLEEFYRKTGETEFEISELKKNGVKDGCILILKRANSPKSLAEVDVFVFESIEGAEGFFEYIKNRSEAKDWKKLDIGDETVFHSTDSTHIWLSRVSNAFVRVIVWNGEAGRETGMRIISKIAGKIKF
jgi:hypothetical protein